MSLCEREKHPFVKGERECFQIKISLCLFYALHALLGEKISLSEKEKRT